MKEDLESGNILNEKFVSFARQYTIRISARLYRTTGCKGNWDATVGLYTILHFSLFMPSLAKTTRVGIKGLHLIAFNHFTLWKWVVRFTPRRFCLVRKSRRLTGLQIRSGRWRESNPGLSVVRVVSSL